jgi:hypothetical protein
MFNLCEGNKRSKIVLDLTRFYSEEELYAIATIPTRLLPVSIEFGPNLYQNIESVEQMRFVCSMWSKDHSSYISEDDYLQHKLDLDDMVHTAKVEKSLEKSTAHSHKVRTRRECAVKRKKPPTRAQRLAMATSKTRAATTTASTTTASDASDDSEVSEEVADDTTGAACRSLSCVVSVSNEPNEDYQRVRGMSAATLSKSFSTSSLDDPINSL